MVTENPILNYFVAEINIRKADKVKEIFSILIKNS